MHGKLPLWKKIHLSYLNFNLQVISIKKNSKTIMIRLLALVNINIKINKGCKSAVQGLLVQFNFHSYIFRF